MPVPELDWPADLFADTVSLLRGEEEKAADPEPLWLAMQRIWTRTRRTGLPHGRRGNDPEESPLDRSDRQAWAPERYFGTAFGCVLPLVPGGGITGMGNFSPAGGATFIPGSTFAGGRRTPE
ncbi:MAG: hypothetical protein ABI369_05535 [Acetobacteraceae bacterium]